MSVSEHMEQVQLVSWFRKTYEGVLIFAIPNGGQRNAVTASFLKAEGVVAGIPDLFVPQYNLWIEMKKAEGGRLSAIQKERIAYLKSIGHKAIVGFGFEDAKDKIINILG